MKINVLSNDLELISILNDIEGSDVKTIDVEQIDEKKIDVVVISNNLLKIDKFINLLASSENKIKSLFFYLSDDSDHELLKKIDNKLLESHNIIVVPAKRTVLQIQKLIISKFYNTVDINNVIAFFGSDSKVGTSVISNLVALNLAKRSEEKNICLLNLHGQTGFDWIDNSKHETGLSDIRIAISNRILNGTTVKEISYRLLPNFYILKGEKNIETNRYYSYKEINALIKVCKECFDVVIIDAGNTNNLYLHQAYSSLINADTKILVTDNTSKSYEMYDIANNQIFAPLKIEEFQGLIVNKYFKTSHAKKDIELAEIYNLPLLAVLPYCEFYYQANYEKNPSLFLTDRRFKNNYQKMIKYVESKMGITVKEKSKKLFNFGGK